MVEDGFPGSPNRNFPVAIPKTSGCPGWIRTRSKKNSAENVSSTFSLSEDERLPGLDQDAVEKEFG
jgi:hypothetical protein